LSKASSQAPFSEDSVVVSQIITSTQLTGDAATAAEDYLNNLLTVAITEADRFVRFLYIQLIF
jgi:hypothetical protein